MKIQIIYCHPSKKSYTFQILEQLKSHLETEGLQYEVSDLYAMDFKTDMTEEEYEREGFVNLDLPIPIDVKEEHKKIEQADCLIFLYPVWWTDCPAKLKGWFDRVLSVGYAYSHDDSNHIGKMKTLKYGMVLCTAGHSNDYLQESGNAESMRNVMLDDRLGDLFENKEMILLGGTMDKEKVRQTHSKILHSIGSKIKTYFV